MENPQIKQQNVILNFTLSISDISISIVSLEDGAIKLARIYEIFLWNTVLSSVFNNFEEFCHIGNNNSIEICRYIAAQEEIK